MRLFTATRHGDGRGEEQGLRQHHHMLHVRRRRDLAGFDRELVEILAAATQDGVRAGVARRIPAAGHPGVGQVKQHHPCFDSVRSRYRISVTYVALTQLARFNRRRRYLRSDRSLRQMDQMDMRIASLIIDPRVFVIEGYRTPISSRDREIIRDVSTIPCGIFHSERFIFSTCANIRERCDYNSVYILRAVIFPRWLLSKGKDGEVEKIYRKMARMNDLQVSTEAIDIFKELNVAKVETVRGALIFYRSSIAHACPLGIISKSCLIGILMCD